MSEKKPKGVGFLITPVGSETIFTPESFSEDQKMFAETAERFVQDEILPVADELNLPDEDHSHH